MNSPRKILLGRMALTALLLGPVLPYARGEEPPVTSPSPAPSATEETPALSASATPTPTPAPPAVRNVRISFLPPPLDGKISLGIYDAKGELVRVLHREASFDAFTVGADALVTKWDGKDDQGNDRPGGKYHARGFLVGPLKVDETPAAAESPVEANPSATVQVKLMPNPLNKSSGAMVDLAVAFDGSGVFLKTADGLPLMTVSPKSNLARVSIRKDGDKAVGLLLEENGTPARLRISNVDKMMAFDCGDFELK